MDNFSIPSQRIIDSFGGYDSDYTVYSGNSSEDWKRILNMHEESPPDIFLILKPYQKTIQIILQLLLLLLRYLLHIVVHMRFQSALKSTLAIAKLQPCRQCGPSSST